jgi:hypothetical protein
MNFLAHSLVATELLRPVHPLPAYALGNALPDLLPLASSRSRLRLGRISSIVSTPAEKALRAGVLAHLYTDKAFHATTAFAAAQADVRMLLAQAGFSGIRVRRFFLAHILTELALDAALLRADHSLAERFYGAFGSADYAEATRWAETTLAIPLPDLPAVLSRFSQFPYLYSYAEDGGVAEGINRLCARAHQDMFSGDSEARLLTLVSQAVSAVGERAAALLTETGQSAQTLIEAENLAHDGRNFGM